ncbi:MAG: endonuclease [Acholeplasmataceae bacterium]|nr:endonuclease [Acholeplasmataceae bacterium]
MTKRHMRIITLLILFFVLNACSMFQNYVTVIYELNGGLGHVSSEQINQGSRIILKDQPEKEGYLFFGWYKNEQMTVPWDFDVDVVDEKLTLYALWVLDEDYEFNLPDHMDFSIWELRLDETVLKWNSVDQRDDYHIYLNDELIATTTEEEFSINAYQGYLTEEKIFSVAAKKSGFKEGERKHIRVYYIPEKANELAYEANLEGDTQGSYLTGEIDLNEQPWYFGDAMLGALESDRKIGVRAIRMRSSFIETGFTVDQVTSLSFYYGIFSTNNSNTLTVYAKSEMSEWIEIETFVTSTELQKAIIEEEDLRTHFLLSDRLFFKFEIGSGTNKSVNIDNIEIYQYIEEKYIGAIVTDFLSYYEGVEGLRLEELVLFLRARLSIGFIGLTYGKAKEVLEIADRHPSQVSNVLTIYSRQSVPGSWDSTSWHREHVWPNSRLGVPRVTETGINIASDAHNLRAIVPSVNSSRSNRYFGPGNGLNTTVGTNAYYPGDGDKGDVARILFYMVVKYDWLELVDTPLANDPETNYTLAGAKMGLLSLLLIWHIEDPVDDFERNRNEVIFEYQNNRNPFIDHPELVDYMYDDTHLSQQENLEIYRMEVSLLMTLPRFEAKIEKTKKVYFVA